MSEHNSNTQASESTNLETAINEMSWVKTFQLIINYVIQKWHPAWIISILVLAIVSFLIAYKIGLVDKLLLESSNSSERCELIEYEMLKDEMRLTEVRSIFQDRGTKTKSQSNFTTYVWKKKGVTVIADFEDNKLISSYQNCFR